MTTLDPIMHAGQTPAVSARDRAMLVHDLRDALQGVLGGVAILDAIEATPAARTQVDRIGAASTTLAWLVNRLLGEELSPAQRETHSCVDVPRFLRHLAKRWDGAARERGLRFMIEPEAGLPGRLRVDLTSLARALGNLIGNAIVHGRSREVRLAVRRTFDEGVAFEVVDEGPGLPQPVLDRVLRPGARTPSASADGHGLGLHIARGLCAEMGGDFALANRPGGGAAASLAFPGALCESDAAVSGADSGRFDLAGVRILLAEDNPTNQMVAMQMLRALDASVTLSSDGVEALEKFEEAEFDIVVVDIEMPRLSGLDVIRAIRGRGDARAGVPIVALTAYVMREHRDRIAEAGANGLISKPITSVEALGQILRAHVPQRPVPAGSPPDAAEDVEPVADLAVFDALCAAIGEGMMAELLGKVVADLMQARADLAGALSPLDPGPIRSASHILVSVAGAIGATRLQNCARALYAAASGGEGRALPRDVSRCLDEIDAAVAFAHSQRARG